MCIVMFDLFFKFTAAVVVVSLIAAITSSASEAIIPLLMGAVVIWVLYHAMSGLGG